MESDHLEENNYKVEWIDNEGLLRDEGCFSGQAPQGLRHKLSAIEAYYKVKMAPTTANLEKILPEIGKMYEEIKIKEEANEIALEELYKLKSYRPIEEAIPWLGSSLMFLLCSIIIVANYFFVALLVRPFNTSWWLPAAIMGVGMFILFSEETVWSLKDRDVTANIGILKWVIELLPPLISTTLIGAITYNFYSFPVFLGGTFFSMILFLFCGKLVLSFKTQLSKNYQLHSKYKVAIREYNKTVSLQDEKILRIATEKSKFENTLTELLNAKEILRAKEIGLLEECRVKHEVFLSEYEFTNSLNSHSNYEASKVNSLTALNKL